MQTLAWHEYFDAKPREKIKLVAWCNSISCNLKHNPNSLGARKENAKSKTSFCPDCGNALYWHREIAKHAVREWTRKDFG